MLIILVHPAQTKKDQLLLESQSKALLTAQVSRLHFIFRTFVFSVARAFAHRNLIDIDSVSGTGKDGRVTKGDLISHMEGQTAEKVRSTPAVRAFAKQNNLNINHI